MALKQSEGSILLETLIAFSCFLILISLLPTIVTSMKLPLRVSEEFLKPMEAQLFYEQLGLEMRQSKNVSVNWSSISLMKENGDVITIELYGTYLRRRVNKRGNEIFVRNVKDVNFTAVNNGIIVELIGRNGTKIKKRLSLTPFRKKHDET